MENRTLIPASNALQISLIDNCLFVLLAEFPLKENVPGLQPSIRTGLVVSLADVATLGVLESRHALRDQVIKWE